MVAVAPKKFKKKATNVTIREDLLIEAKALHVNVSATLELALTAELKRRRDANWQEENLEAIEAYNAFVAEHGIFAAGFRTW